MKLKGLTGKQGVLMPASNAGDLMLKKEVVEAIREGMFHIWAVDSVDEGIEVLTGLPAGQLGEDGACYTRLGVCFTFRRIALPVRE